MEEEKLNEVLTTFTRVKNDIEERAKKGFYDYQLKKGEFSNLIVRRLEKDGFYVIRNFTEGNFLICWNEYTHLTATIIWIRALTRGAIELLNEEASQEEGDFANEAWDALMKEPW